MKVLQKYIEKTPGWTPFGWNKNCPNHDILGETSDSIPKDRVVVTASRWSFCGVVNGGGPNYLQVLGWPSTSNLPLLLSLPPIFTGSSHLEKNTPKKKPCKAKRVFFNQPKTKPTLALPHSSLRETPNNTSLLNSALSRLFFVCSLPPSHTYGGDKLCKGAQLTSGRNEFKNATSTPRILYINSSWQPLGPLDGVQKSRSVP